MPSAYLQWRFHSGEQVVARGPLVIPCHTIVAGYYGIMLAVPVSVCLSIRTYARYIGRLAFVLVPGLFRHCGVKNCVVGLINR